jgi:uncharacterized DUF497 family protein
VKDGGLDFADLDEGFLRAIHDRSWQRRPADRRGRPGDGVVVVVFVTLGSEGLSVISMRPANAKERKLLDG